MLDKSTTGLVLVDVQGKLARIVHNSEEVISKMVKLIQGCQALGVPIVWLEQYPAGLGATVPELSDIIENNSPIEKFTFNGLDTEAVLEAIKSHDKENWLLCGIESHICVYQTARGIKNLGLNAEVVTDAVSSRASESIDLALRKYEQHNIGLTSVEMCLYELVKDAKSPDFKKILPLIK